MTTPAGVPLPGRNVPASPLPGSDVPGISVPALPYQGYASSAGFDDDASDSAGLAGADGDAQAPGRWRLSTAGAATAVVGIILIGLGLVIGRPDLAVIGTPMILSVLWDLAGKGPPRLHRSGRPSHHGEAAEIREILDLEPGAGRNPLGAGSIALRVSAAGYRETTVLIAAPPLPRRIDVAVGTARTGAHQVFRLDWLALSPNAMAQTPVSSAEERRLLVLPGARMLRELPLPFRLQGLTGAHSGRRAGEGGDLRDVSLFAPGDRLRRIDWPATARHSAQHGGAIRDLYVRRDFAMADAVVMLVVDSRDEVGPDVTAWSGSSPLRPDEATSLDIAREAAASLARRYLRGGDRVGLDDLGRQSRPVAPAGGPVQLRRLTHRLAVLAPEGTPRPYLRAPQVPSGSLVIVFSTFLDGEAADLARLWRRSGHRVIAVDVLPDPLTMALPLPIATAFRIVSMERSDRIRELGASGIEVVRWPSAQDRAPGADATVELAAIARIRAGRR